MIFSQNNPLDYLFIYLTDISRSRMENRVVHLSRSEICACA